MSAPNTISQRTPHASKLPNGDSARPLRLLNLAVLEIWDQWILENSVKKVGQYTSLSGRVLDTLVQAMGEPGLLQQAQKNSDLDHKLLARLRQELKEHPDALLVQVVEKIAQDPSSELQARAQHFLSPEFKRVKGEVLGYLFEYVRSFPNPHKDLDHLLITQAEQLEIDNPSSALPQKVQDSLLQFSSRKSTIDWVLAKQQTRKSGGDWVDAVSKTLFQMSPESLALDAVVYGGIGKMAQWTGRAVGGAAESLLGGRMAASGLKRAKLGADLTSKGVTMASGATLYQIQKENQAQPQIPLSAKRVAKTFGTNLLILGLGDLGLYLGKGVGLKVAQTPFFQNSLGQISPGGHAMVSGLSHAGGLAGVVSGGQVARGTGLKDSPWQDWRGDLVQDALMYGGFFFLQRGAGHSLGRVVRQPISPAELQQRQERVVEMALKGLEGRQEYLRFLLEVEALERAEPLSSAELEVQYAAFRKKFNDQYYGHRHYDPHFNLETGELLGNPEIQAEVMIEQNHGVFRINLDGQPHISPLLHCPAGNCSARSKYVLALSDHIQLRPPKGQRQVLGFYADHVELFWYDPAEQSITSLINGNKKPVDADLYNPEVIFQSYLDKRGVPTLSRKEDFLVFRSSPEEAIAWNFGANPHNVGNDPFYFPAGPELPGSDWAPLGWLKKPGEFGQEDFAHPLVRGGFHFFGKEVIKGVPNGAWSIVLGALAWSFALGMCFLRDKNGVVHLNTKVEAPIEVYPVSEFNRRFADPALDIPETVVPRVPGFIFNNNLNLSSRVKWCLREETVARYAATLIVPDADYPQVMKAFANMPSAPNGNWEKHHFLLDRMFANAKRFNDEVVKPLLEFYENPMANIEAGKAPPERHDLDFSDEQNALKRLGIEDFDLSESHMRGMQLSVLQLNQRWDSVQNEVNEKRKSWNDFVIANLDAVATWFHDSSYKNKTAIFKSLDESVAKKLVDKVLYERVLLGEEAGKKNSMRPPKEKAKEPLIVGDWGEMEVEYLAAPQVKPKVELSWQEQLANLVDRQGNQEASADARHASADLKMDSMLWILGQVTQTSFEEDSVKSFWKKNLTPNFVVFLIDSLKREDIPQFKKDKILVNAMRVFLTKQDRDEIKTKLPKHLEPVWDYMIKQRPDLISQVFPPAKIGP